MSLNQEYPGSIDSFLNKVKQQYQKFDIFINNAVARPMKGYAGDMEQFRQSMEINATGMFHLLRGLSDWLAETGGGSVVNIASMMGSKGPDYSNYKGTSMGDLPPDYFFHNAGLVNLNLFMSKKFAGKNIRFNCISPGGLFNHQPELFVQNYCEKVPLGRMANADDIKGQIILMDGGLNA